VFLDCPAEGLFVHPDPVVADSDRLRAAALDCHAYSGGVGVEAVLDQLLDDRGRPLDDFAGRDPFDCGRIEFPYLRGHSLRGIVGGPP